jgi:serine phosphatase RsbU (regulator of sigma subunit)
MVLNQDKSVLSFASANNTIVIIRNGEILEYKGDKMPVGKHDRDTESFTLHSVQLKKGDVIYALTDGFPDQFGGPKGKKYMIKNLKNKFLQIADMPMTKQEEFLSEEFSNWMQDNEQIDDDCIIGVRV